MLNEAEKTLLASVEDLGAVKQFINQSLTQKSEGETYYYENVCKQLRDRDDPEMVYKVMVSLASYASVITGDPDCYSELVTSIYSYDWKSDRKISIAFVNLVGCIVSANATYLIPSFQMLAKSLVPTDNDLCSSSSVLDKEHKRKDSEKEDAQTLASLHTSHIESMSEQYDRVHRTLQGLVKLAPSGQDELYPVLVTCFPHKRFSKGILSEFVRQILRISEYLPSLQEKIIDLILSRSLEIDVEIVIEDTGEVKIVEDYQGEQEGVILGLGGVDRGVNQDDRAEHITGAKGLNSGNVSNERGQRIPAAVTEMADKLDAILYVMIQYIDRQFTLGETHTDRLLHHLLSAFEGRVLFTYRSKFVQFLFFYTAQLSEKFAIGFGHRLVRVFLEGAGPYDGHSTSPFAQVNVNGLLNSSPIRLGEEGIGGHVESGLPVGNAGGSPERGHDSEAGETNGNNMKVQSAVLYLASYLGRARFVPPETVLRVLECLIQWADRYIAHVGAIVPMLSKPYASAAKMGAIKSGNPSENGDIEGKNVDPQTPFSRKGSKRSLSITDYRDRPLDDEEDEEAASRGSDDSAKRASLGSSNQCRGDIGSSSGVGRAEGSPKHSHAPLPPAPTQVWEKVSKQAPWLSPRRVAEEAVTRHETFYTCVQACCYVACFYGVDLATQIKSQPFTLAAWERVLCSRLSPLKYCLQSIRGEFLRLASAGELFSGFFWASLPPEVLLDAPNLSSPSGNMTVDDAGSGNEHPGNAPSNTNADADADASSYRDPAPSETGARSTASPRSNVLPGVAVAGRSIHRVGGNINRIGLKVPQKSPNNRVIGTGANPLESFFPFDPCLLEIMHCHVEKRYRRWSGLPGVDVDNNYPYQPYSSSRSNTLNSVELGDEGVEETVSLDAKRADRGSLDDYAAVDQYLVGRQSSSSSGSMGIAINGGHVGAARENKERGGTITSLASSISSVMSLADVEASGLCPEIPNDSERGVSVLHEDSERGIAMTRTGSFTSISSNNDDNNSNTGIRHLARSESMCSDVDDESGHDDDGGSLRGHFEVAHGRDVRSSPTLLQRKQDHRRPRLYSVGSTDSW